ncbi:hypothetical protein [Pararhizobium sp. PWRC1-1]|uniref:hypothetical protein n=1 Tax=Pararhizobium sp. PWRC1-1 TaxID=2804566 RepID=UPI003CF7E3BE
MIIADDRTVHANYQVHFEHWCGHEGCKRWGSLEKTQPRENRVALHGAPGGRRVGEAFIFFGYLADASNLVAA